MNEFRNLNGKRVFNTSSDRKYIDIRLKDFITRITAGTNGAVCEKSSKMYNFSPENVQVILRQKVYKSLGESL